jgi:hypothetical protein
MPDRGTPCQPGSRGRGEAPAGRRGASAVSAPGATRGWAWGARPGAGCSCRCGGRAPAGRDLEDGVLLVAEGAVRVNTDGDGVLQRAERLVEERNGPEQMPTVGAPRAARRVNPRASGAACPMASATWARGMASVWYTERDVARRGRRRQPGPGTAPDAAPRLPAAGGGARRGGARAPRDERRRRGHVRPPHAGGDRPGVPEDRGAAVAGDGPRHAHRARGRQGGHRGRQPGRGVPPADQAGRAGRPARGPAARAGARAGGAGGAPGPTPGAELALAEHALQALLGPEAARWRGKTRPGCRAAEAGAR